MHHLQLQKTCVLKPLPPFHFDGTFRKPSHFPAPVDVFNNDGYFFAMRLDERVVGIRLFPDAETVVMEIYADSAVASADSDKLAREVYFRFGMGIDLNDFLSTAARDKLLGSVVERWQGMRPSCTHSLYENLCITIVLQNTRVSRSVTMLRNLLERYGEHVEYGGTDLYAFWLPSTLGSASEDELRALKVGYRAKSFIRVSQFFAENPGMEQEVRKLGKEEASVQLRRIYGVGPATAWYLLFECFKHPDAFDHVSPWETQILSRLMFGEESMEPAVILSEAAKRWGAWRMLAVHYLFEDLFWRHKAEPISWLAELIRL